jgi:hypothetical protein
MKNRDKDSAAGSYCNTQMWVFLVNIKVAFRFIINPGQRKQGYHKKRIAGWQSFLKIL